MKQELSISTYMLRILGSGYLIYLGITLIDSMRNAQGMLQGIELICIAIFCIVGIILGGFSIKELIRLKGLEECRENRCTNEKA